MDEETLAWLRDAVREVANDEQFRERMTEMGAFVVYENAEAFEARARKDAEVARRVLDSLGMLGMGN